jgi:hypothetical protein
LKTGFDGVPLSLGVRKRAEPSSVGDSTAGSSKDYRRRLKKSLSR